MISYGFIKPENYSLPDVFVHYSEIEEKGVTSLEKGQLIEFTLEIIPKGPIGKKVRFVKNPKKPG